MRASRGRHRGFVCALVLGLSACNRDGNPSPPSASASTSQAGLKVTSRAFAHGATIPRKYGCKGEDVSPPLAWSGVPASAKGLALVMYDPDAPAGTWVHWVLLLPPDVSQLAEGSKELPAGARQGTNSWGKIGYGGPCPPSGTHRYFFQLSALDTDLASLQHPTREVLESAMKGHVVARGELMGTYGK